MKKVFLLKKHPKNITLSFVITLIAFSGVLGILYKSHEDNRMIYQVFASSVSYTPTFNPDGTLILNKGAIAGRVVDTLTQIIINDGDIYTPEDDNIVKNTVIYQHNMDSPRGYKLLVMVDYIQTEFYVDNVKYNSYSFELEEEDSIYIDVEIDLNGRDADEIDYIMIIDHDYGQMKDNEEDVSKMAYLRYISRAMFWKVRLKEASTKIDNIEFDNNWEQIFEEEIHLSTVTLIEDRKIDPQQIDTDYDNLLGNYFQFAHDVKGADIYSLLINNWHKDIEMDYVVFQLLDWNQVPFEDGEILKYMQLPPGSLGQYKIKLPLVDTEGIYVVFVIEKPFSNISHEISPMVDSTERSIIRP